MPGFRFTNDGRVLCALYCHPQCEGYIARENLWVDEHGDTWDICKLCQEWESSRT